MYNTCTLYIQLRRTVTEERMFYANKPQTNAQFSSHTHTHTHTHSTAESEPSLGLEMLWMSFVQTPNPKTFEGAATNGSAAILAEMLKKWPEQVNCKLKWMHVFIHR